MLPTFCQRNGRHGEPLGKLSSASAFGGLRRTHDVPARQDVVATPADTGGLAEKHVYVGDVMLAA